MESLAPLQRAMVSSALRPPAVCRARRPVSLPAATVACLRVGQVVLDQSGCPHVVIEATSTTLRLALRTGAESLAYRSEVPWAWVEQAEELAWVVEA